MQIMLHSYTARLISVTFALASVGLGTGLSATKAIAQTIYPFNGNYDAKIDIVPINEELSQSIELATSSDPEAPYGLTQYEGLIYARTDPATGALNFDTNPATFGLPDLEPGYILFEGEGTDNKLRGTATATALPDRETLTGVGSGTLTITGGEGLFEGATGTLNFTQIDQLNPDPNVLSIEGDAVITGSIEVPEPGGIGTLAGIGALGTGLMLHRRRQRLTKNT
jgi:hypothetical protein